MALASILFMDADGKLTMRPVSIEQAIAAHNALTGLTEPSEAQAEWLLTIRRIFIPPSHRPANYSPVYATRSTPIPQKPVTDTGIQQGMYEAIPKGDR